MTDFQKELITAVEEVAMNTGLTTEECIRQAIEILGRDKNEI